MNTIFSRRQPRAARAAAKPNNNAALAHFGHAIDMAVYDMRVDHKSRRSNTNLVALSVMLHIAALEISDTPESMSTATRGYVLTLLQRENSYDTVTAATLATTVAQQLTQAANGTLRRKALRLLNRELIEFGSDSLSASGVASTPESYIARSSEALRMSAFAITF
jgi:hypothetical protein